VLLCLKALCTTKPALRELTGIQSTLFPALVDMIFDEEHKGPSEFNTRGIIISLLRKWASSLSPCLRPPPPLFFFSSLLRNGPLPSRDLPLITNPLSPSPLVFFPTQ
jgi:hypothetical protein